MKKRPYKTRTVNFLQTQKILDAVRGQRVIVGIDIAKTKMAAAILLENREVLGIIGWNHPTEWPSFMAALLALNAKSVEIVLEPSGPYGTALMHQVSEQWPVHIISGKRVHDAVEVFDSVPSSHDGKCAVVIGLLHLQGGSRRWVAPTNELRTLKMFVRRYEVYSIRLREERNRLEAMLAECWPEVLTIANQRSKSFLALLKDFREPAEVRADEAGATSVLKASSRRQLPNAKIALILQSARSSIGCELSEGDLFELGEILDNITRYESRAEALKEQILEAQKKSPTALRIEKVVGPMTSAILVSALDEASSYPSAAAYLKAAGLNLKEQSSGEERGKAKITKRGPGILRKYLFLAVMRLTQTDPVVSAWYEKKCLSNGGVKMRAMVALMRKLMRALWHIARSGAPFDATKLFDLRALDIPKSEKSILARRNKRLEKMMASIEASAADRAAEVHEMM